MEDIVRYKRLEGVQDALRKISAAAFEGDVQRAGFREPALWSTSHAGDLGDQDQIIPASHASFPGDVRVHVLAGTGQREMEAAAEVNRLLNDFLGR